MTHDAHVTHRISAAHTAMLAWTSLSPHARGRMLYDVADVMRDRRDELAGELALTTGIKNNVASADVSAAIGTWTWYAGWADKFGAHLRAREGEQSVTHEPSGVVVIVTPPRPSLHEVVAALVPPLVAGCSVVAIAHEQEPSPTVMLVEILAQSPLPAGVLSVLTGGASELGAQCGAHGDVAILELLGLGNTKNTLHETPTMRVLLPEDTTKDSPLLSLDRVIRYTRRRVLFSHPGSML